MTDTLIKRNFEYHSPDETQTDKFQLIRLEMRVVARMLEQLCPESRELSLAMTNLEQCSFWANASIAREDK